jgi:hypothetical protein
MANLRLLQAVLLAGLIAAPALAQSPTMTPAVPQPAHMAPGASLFEDPEKNVPTATVTVRIDVPRDSRAVEVMAVHPYPMKPPTIPGPPPKLATDDKTLRDLLVQSGYAARSNPDKPYPIGGWRWQFAYQEAVRRSGLGVPHGLFTVYSWVNDIRPYVRKECKKWNDFEDERWLRYKRAKEEFEKSRVEIENDAVRLGLSPIDMRIRRGIAQAKVPAGNWWLTCTHKKPGLTYYWQVPFTAGGGENVNLNLTQPNALIVTGGW